MEENKEILQFMQLINRVFKMKIQTISILRNKSKYSCQLKVRLNTNQENHCLKIYLRYQIIQTVLTLMILKEQDPQLEGQVIQKKEKIIKKLRCFIMSIYKNLKSLKMR